MDFVHSQALFASVLPEILELLGQQSKWAGAYHGTKGKRYNFCLSGIWLCNPPSICIPCNNNNPSMHFANPSISNPPPPRLQAMFAGSIPEIIDLIGIRRKYGGTFKVTKRSVCVPAVRSDY